MGGSGVWKESGSKPCYNLTVFKSNSEDLNYGRRSREGEKVLDPGSASKKKVN